MTTSGLAYLTSTINSTNGQVVASEEGGVCAEPNALRRMSHSGSAASLGHLDSYCSDFTYLNREVGMGKRGKQTGRIGRHKFKPGGPVGT